MKTEQKKEAQVPEQSGLRPDWALEGMGMSGSVSQQESGAAGTCRWIQMREVRKKEEVNYLRVLASAPGTSLYRGRKDYR